MHQVRTIALFGIATACLAAMKESPTRTISFEDDGRTKNEIPAPRPGDILRFNLPANVIVKYQLSPDISDGKLLVCGDDKLKADDTTVTIPSSVKVARPGIPGDKADEKPVKALYFNLFGGLEPEPADKARLDELQAQLGYYSSLNRPLSWVDKKRLSDQIAEKNDRISQFQEEIKAYTGMSLGAAVGAIDERQRAIRDLRTEIKDAQRSIDNGSLEEKLTSLRQQVDELKARIESNPNKLLRAGVLLVGENRKAVYYLLNPTADKSAPWHLKRFQNFPELTTDDTPYAVILGQRFKQDPKALRATFTTKAGSYIDSDPVRPQLTQVSVPSSGGTLKILKEAKAVCAPGDTPAYAYVDRVLQFTDRLAGETIYSLTVTGYGQAVQTDTLTVSTGTSASNQHQTVQAMLTLKPLDGDAWPQVHSLYRYNLATGVIWTSVGSPTFSRIATGNYLPAGCSPTTSISISTPGPGATDPSTATSISCLPIYQTLTVAGGPRVLPAVMFSRYWRKRDTQRKNGSWWWAAPVPTVGISLSTPTDDFFLGGSSEFPFLRNIQLVYGAHLGRVGKLGANGFQIPTDNTAPQATTSLHVGEYVGLTFNLDFVKGIFKK